MHVWGDGGHVAEVWAEAGLWRYALIHVPTGEILSQGADALRWRAVERLRRAAATCGLQEWPRARRRVLRLNRLRLG